ncbi:hypothetical protein J2S40_000804 [Nocardioides luteus]|uniref:Lipoprotein LpqB beta-propeller domain-containing protein n=1 Tax=Nocardioides luteus TaxID=1844 RepID=A0ABQ5ST63_9ACTN|nr:hypothetical protein [Nocardioides luteus]MDR7309746.1 hypothetical protein [Nocardioides luteus]GGR61644.1 hypothetical protein GCM10010197_31080 [Nocardioides luteus]GLJ67345.1 hypothetical protein GCM10017579_13810 [Nocardioides luteus]
MHPDEQPATRHRPETLFSVGVALALIASVAWLAAHTTRLAESRADADVATPAPPAPTVHNSTPAIPATYADLPLGPATTLPFVDLAGRLRLGAAPQPVHGSRMSMAGWTVLMYERAAHPGPVWIARRGSTVQVPGLWTQPVLSKDGSRLFALQETGKDTSALIAVDTVSGKEVDRRALDGAPSATALLGTDRRRVYFRTMPSSGRLTSSLPPVVAWDPGRSSQRISLPLDHQQLSPLRRGALLHNPGDAEARFAALEADGSLAQPGVRTPLPGTVADSPDGSVVAVAGDPDDPDASDPAAERGFAVDMSTSDLVDLRIPMSVETVHVAGFESDRSLVLHTSSAADSWYLRCWVDTGSCDRITGSSRTPEGHQIRIPGLP